MRLYSEDVAMQTHHGVDAGRNGISIQGDVVPADQTIERDVRRWIQKMCHERTT